MKRLYAIVDVETTGGYAADNRMIEIAVAIHDGEKVIETYETLLNPGRRIPPYISGFTGISNEMVITAPGFNEIASDLYKLLEGKVFVAHNVNFDFSFVQKAFSDVGISFKANRLCTIRLARKIWPGLKSYSLGNLCQHMAIPLHHAHRAGADCLATATLFELMNQQDADGHIAQSLKKSSLELILPPNLPRKQFDSLPKQPGVYYFLDIQGKPIYVGKAISIKQRVASHFSGKNETERKQQFLREIYGVKFELCGNELMALLFELQEIKRLWPKYNSALKRPEVQFGLYVYEDRMGLINLAIDKVKKFSQPVRRYASMLEARTQLESLVKSYNLNRMYCGYEKMRMSNSKLNKGDRIEGETAKTEYNERVIQAIDSLRNFEKGGSFALIGTGRFEYERSVVVVNEGKYVGYMFQKSRKQVADPKVLLHQITKVADYPESMWIIRSFLQKASHEEIITLD